MGWQRKGAQGRERGRSHAGRWNWELLVLSPWQDSGPGSIAADYIFDGSILSSAEQKTFRPTHLRVFQYSATHKAPGLAARSMYLCSLWIVTAR